MQRKGEEHRTQDGREAPVVNTRAQCSWQIILTHLGAGNMGTAMAQGSRDETERIANTLPGGSSSPDWLTARQEVKLTVTQWGRTAVGDPKRVCAHNTPAAHALLSLGRVPRHTPASCAIHSHSPTPLSNPPPLAQAPSRPAPPLPAQRRPSRSSHSTNPVTGRAKLTCGVFQLDLPLDDLYRQEVVPLV